VDSNDIPQIGKYEVVDVLGRGGMGVVYRAIDKRIGRNVAIKTLTQGFVGDPEMLARFYDEAKRTGGLQHPNIVTIYELGDHQGLPYIVMECIDGQTLDKIIQSNSPLPTVAQLKIVEEVCLALGYAHRNNVIHRDVKPANIIVQPDGVAKLLDFGIAKLNRVDRETGHTRNGRIIGTVPYMAPERLRDLPIDGRSDIFAAGVLMYQLLSGQLPFSGEDAALVEKLLHDNHAPLSSHREDLPAPLEGILDRALAKNPDERYSTADEMAIDLSSVIADLRQEQVGELFPQAKRLAESQEFPRARAILQQLLRIDTRHAAAKRLLSEIQQQAARRQREEMLTKLRCQGEEALRGRRYDQAIAAFEEASKLDASNLEFVELLESARREKQRQEHIDEFLRQADGARRKGDFVSAIAAAQKALRTDSNNSKILALCDLLTKEAGEAEKREQARRLVGSARGEIGERRYLEAIDLLREAETLDPANPEQQLLRADANAGLDRARRRRLIAQLREQAAAAATTEQLQAAARSINEALESMPTEAALLLHKGHLDRQLKDRESRRLVDETVQSCRSLPPGEALNRVRQALQQIPGDDRLLSLQSLLVDRLQQQTLKERRTERLMRARDALKQGGYAEAVQILEACQNEGIATEEMIAVLEFARREAAEQKRRERVQEVFVEAQALLHAQEYAAAIKLLESAPEHCKDTALQNLFEQACAGQSSLQQEIEAALETASALVQDERPQEAIRYLKSRPSPFSHSSRFQLALGALQESCHREDFRTMGAAYALLASDLSAASSVVRSAIATSGDSETMRLLADAFRSRKQAFAARGVSSAIAKSQAALQAGDPQMALEILQSARPMLDDAGADLQKTWHRTQKAATSKGLLMQIRNRFRS